MKHLESFNEINERIRTRKVYWIIPFNGNEFEDAIVQTFFQYIERKRDIQRIEHINDALELAQDARSKLSKSEFVLLSMEFDIDTLTDEVKKLPMFHVFKFEDKEKLEKDGYIFVGYTNTTKEEVDLKLQTTKYNL